MLTLRREAAEKVVSPEPKAAAIQPGNRVVNPPVHEAEQAGQ